MSRRITGSIRQVGSSFEVIVPKPKDPTTGRSTGRMSRSFATREEAVEWRDAAVAALRTGRPVPEPSELVRTGLEPRARVVMSLADVAEAWYKQAYVRLPSSGYSRMRGVRSRLDNWVLPFFADVSNVRTLTVHHGTEFSNFLAGEDVTWRGTPVYGRSGLPVLSQDPTQPLELVGAAELLSVTVADVEKALRRTQPGAGAALVCTPQALADADLVELARPRGLSKAYATEVLWALGALLQFGITLGALEERPWEPASRTDQGDVHSIEPKDSRRLRTPSAKDTPLSVDDVRSIAEHLHWVHQFTLWLLRLLGLRLSEAFGLRVSDIQRIDNGAVVVVNKQGGRLFWFRNGEHEWESAQEVSTVKTPWSVRAIAIPSALLQLIDLIIATCHTDPVTGEVNQNARLIPGIRTPDAGGQEGFRAALAKAGERAGLGHLIPKLMRSSFATHLNWVDVTGSTPRRMMGQAPGSDVHARHYLLDDPELRTVRQAVARLDASFTGDLFVPALGSPAFGLDHPLRDRVPDIVGQFAAAGWHVHDDAEDPWLTAKEAARMMGRAESHTRRQMVSGVIASELRPVADAHVRMTRRSTVLRFLEARSDRRVLVRVAEEYGQPYHQVRALALRMFGELPTCPASRELVVSDDQQEMLRAELDRVRALNQRAVRSAEAARTLGVHRTIVVDLVDQGRLIQDPESDASRAVFVTRASLRALLASRSPLRARVAAADQVLVEDLVAASGLSARQVTDLCAQGLLQMVSTRAPRTLDRSSVLQWAAGYRPDLLQSF